MLHAPNLFTFCLYIESEHTFLQWFIQVFGRRSDILFAKTKNKANGNYFKCFQSLWVNVKSVTIRNDKINGVRMVCLNSASLKEGLVAYQNMNFFL